MKLVRTSLAALVVFSVYACSSDVTAPETSSEPRPRGQLVAPGGPLFDGGLFGSGNSTDTTTVESTDSTTTP